MTDGRETAELGTWGEVPGARLPTVQEALGGRYEGILGYASKAAAECEVGESDSRFADHRRWSMNLDLCDELIEEGSLAAAKRWLTQMHHERPGDYEVQALLLDVLFKEGFDERDFEWIEEPSVVRLNKATRDRLYLWMRTEGGWVDLCEVRFMAFWCEYLCFEEDALAKHLATDDRFLVEADGPWWMVKALVPD